MQRSVYLAGPISGNNSESASGWRELVKRRLNSAVSCIDPLRDDPDYSIGQPCSGGETGLRDLIHSQQMLARDRWDISHCSLLLANFCGATAISVGTVGELFWADAFRKLIVIVREAGNPHDVPFLNAITPWIYQDLSQAIQKINRLLVG